MNNLRTIKADKFEIKVKEMTLRTGWKLFSSLDELSKGSVQEALEKGADLVLPHAFSIKEEMVNGENPEKTTPVEREMLFEDLLDLTPSELERVWPAFKEANKSFLKILESSGIGKNLKESVEKEFPIFSAVEESPKEETPVQEAQEENFERQTAKAS